MSYIQVFVNGVELDGVQDVDVAFTYSLKDIRDIGSSKGSRSSSITIPRTKQNDIAFGIAGDINAFTGTNKNAAIPAYCLSDSAVIMDGDAFLLDVTETEITFALLESVGALKDELSDLMLSDLDLTDLNHTYNDLDVFDTWSNSYDYIYPLVDYGLFRLRNAGTTSTIHTELKPAVKVERILKQICWDRGITLDTTFFNNPIHRGLIVGFGNGEMLHSPQWVQDRTVFARRIANYTYIVNGSMPIIIDTDVDDPLNEFNTGTWKYTSNEGKTATIKFSFVTANWIPVPVDPTPRVQLEYSPDNGITWLDIDGGGIADVSISQFYEINTTVNLLNGWKIRATINMDGGSLIGSIDMFDVRFRVTPEDVVYSQSTVELSYSLPKWKQIDFLKEIAQLFNLVVYYDSSSKILKIETWHKYFGSGTVDWSDKLDLTDSPVITYNQSDIPSTWGFSYEQPDNDRRLLQFNEKYSDAMPFGDGEYTVASKYGEAKGVVESKFRPVYSGRSYDTATLVPGTQFSDYIIIPNVWEKGQAMGTAEYNCDPMLLIYYGMVDVSILSEGTRQSIKIKATPITQTTIPLCYFVKREYESDAINSWDVNLCFDMPRNEGLLNVWNGQGIIDTYYSELLYNMDKFRMIKVRLNLTSSDIAQLDFGKYVYIDYFRAYFIINKIDQFNPLNNETTEVELIRVAR